MSSLERNKEQKLANRQAILTSGMLIFKEKGYSNASVEDVIVRAEVSRATFYKHFSNKLSLAEALLEEMGSREERAYDRLALIENPSLVDIEEWLENALEIFEQNKILLMVLAEFNKSEPILREMSRSANLKRIRKLSSSLSIFRGMPPQLLNDDPKWNDFLILMAQIDYTLVCLIVGDLQVDRQTAIRFLARQIQHFAADGGRD